MDQIEFIEKLKKYGIEQNMALTRELLFEPINDKGDNLELIQFKKLFLSQSDENKGIIIAYLKQFMEDSMGILLSLLDGASSIGQVGGKFQLYYDKDGERYHINNNDGDYLMTLFYDEDE
ncbi:hypothetical protein [Hymenobacter terrenus]|uniref:hypothetical protein n=1 Tax=Hymenobacter terrenus TaxID=1629124 RepID=UPI000619C628|nr:hypothetical protein [Hymenobacter terrenus]